LSQDFLLNSAWEAMMKRLKDESGQAVVLTLLSMTVLLGFVAFAVDVGLLLRAKRVVQTAADSAAIAGAAELPFGNWVAAAKADAAQNGVTDGSGGATVAVTNISGPSGKTNYVQVIATQPQPTFFMKMFNFNSMPVSARAVAAAVPSPACVYTLLSPAPGSSGPTLGTGGVDVAGSADLELPTCGILDNAQGAFALHVTGGATLKAKAIGIVGTDTVHNGGVLQPNPPTTGMTAVSDPLSSLVPTVPSADYSSGCLADPKYGTGTFTIGPASPSGFVCYTGFSVSKGSPAIALNPGLYIFNGPAGLNIGSGGTFTGTGVTLYFVNGASFAFSNGVGVSLTAPTSPSTYSGLLFYQDPSDTAADTFQGHAIGGVSGIFYLPAANLTLANGTATTFTVDLVVGSLTMSGNATLAPYAPLSGASVLSVPQLVE
jgi:Flp pilus assembly protein TadG